MNQYELPFWGKEILVIGIDEAGRGPIAGPLVVAGAILPIGFQHPEINDSKKLSEKKREQLFTVIKEEAIAYQVEIVSIEEIDQLNIYQATKKAMIKIAKELSGMAVLTDAMPFQLEDKPVVDIIKGDQKSISIAAASILAKVTRDHIMIELHQKYPNYGFDKHKGYPTKMHVEALEEYGVTEVHRKTYEPVKSIVKETEKTIFDYLD